MKKLFPSFLATLLSFSLINPGLAAVEVFSDVTVNTPYQTSIEYLYYQDIVGGYKDGTFKPFNKINRAEFLKILTESVFDQETLKSCLSQRGQSFPDIPTDYWYAKHACIGKEAQIIQGYPDGTFQGNNNINLAEAAKIISKTFMINVASLQEGQVWFEPYISALKNRSAIPNSVTEPIQALNRAEMAEMITRIRRQTLGISDKTEMDDVNLKQVKQEVMFLVNQERKKLGLEALSYNPLLEKSAQLHSNDMKKQDYFDHFSLDGRSPDERIDNIGYLDPYHNCSCSRSYTTGENIAKGQVTASEVIDTWMNSPAHRENILSPLFSEIGIGITPVDEEDMQYAGYIWVQNFGDITLE